MRDYGKVFTKFWESEDIRSLSDNGRLLALYLMTCTHGTIAGVFRLPDGYVCEDMQWTTQKVLESLSELFQKGFANRCETTKWVWIVKHLEWNPPENPNQRKAAVKIALSIPASCAWKQEFMRVCGPLLDIGTPPESNPSETLEEGLLNQKQKQEQKQEQEQEHSAKAEADGLPVETLTKTQLWKAAKSILAEQDMPKEQCGTFVGKLVKDYGDEIVIEAVRATVIARPPDAASYLKACCQHAKGQRTRPNAQEALEAQNRAVAARFLESDDATQ